MSFFVQETGPAAAPTIVFLHGGGGAGWMWQPQVDALGDYHCLVPDLPEQGQSLNEKPFTIQGSAERIAELIRTRAHGATANVVGLSEGAQITVALLALRPELVERAAVSSALVRPIPGASLLTPGLIALSYRWSVPGSMTVMTGAILLYQNTFNAYQSWSYCWALLVAAFGFGMVIRGYWEGLVDLRRKGWALAGQGIIMFLVFGAFFEVFIYRQSRLNANLFWPALLIMAGLSLLATVFILTPRDRAEGSSSLKNS